MDPGVFMCMTDSCSPPRRAMQGCAYSIHAGRPFLWVRYCGIASSCLGGWGRTSPQGPGLTKAG